MSGDYRSVFVDNITRSVQRLLTHIDPAATSLPVAHQTQALHTLSYAFKVSRLWPQTRHLLLAVAPYMEQAGHREVWLPYLEQGITLSRQHNDVDAEAQLRLQVGILHQRRSDYETARGYLEASAALFGKQDDASRQAQALGQLAYVARLQRHFDEAIKLVDRVHQLSAGQAELAYSYLVLGSVAYDRRAWPEAVAAFEKSLRLWPEFDRRMVARTLISLGLALEATKDYQQATTITQQAIDELEELGDVLYQAIARMNLGNIYLRQGQPAAALELYQIAEKVFRQVQDQFHLARICQNKGIAYRRLGRWAEAEAAYTACIQRQRQLGDVVWLVNGMDGLGLVYAEKGDLEAAKMTFQQALVELIAIQGEPGYQHRHDMVSAHLQEVLHQLDMEGRIGLSNRSNAAN